MRTLYAISMILLSWIMYVAIVPAKAQTPEVDVALILLTDVSGSINGDRYEIQKKGIVDALRSRDFQMVLRQSITGKFAIAYVEWSDAGQQKSLGWYVVDVENPASVEALASAIDAHPRAFLNGTSILSALSAAPNIFSSCGCTPVRKVIDISGDGQDATFGSPEASVEQVRRMRDILVSSGVTINGLPIKDNSAGGEGAVIEQYYRENVVGGPGHGNYVANSFSEFGKVFLRKLLLELG